MSAGKLTSVWHGTFTLFGVEMRVHVLSDGQRVFEADSIKALFEAMERADQRLYPEQAEALAKWMRHAGPR